MRTYLTLLVFCCVLLNGCNDYLDLKPDKKMAIPSTSGDLWAILDNYAIMNQSTPMAGEESADTYYLTESSYNSISNVNTRNNYIWADQGERIGDWSNPYRAIFYANVVLDALNDKAKGLAEDEKKVIRGSALFFRSFLFYELAQVFAKPYSEEVLSSPGIPLRLDSDPDAASFRASIGDTYAQIISDLKLAGSLLPVTSAPKNRPSGAAVYGLLARIYLNMGEYENASLYADSCLSVNNALMDYNSLSKTATTPIARFNDEVILASRSYDLSNLLGTSRCRVDTLLYNSYVANDLRKVIFFKKNTDGSYTIKGSYDGAYNGGFFNGIAKDEQYLILAECKARLGDTQGAMAALNTLLSKRFTGFTPYVAATSQQALDLVLAERRKELVLRGTRWSDLRRLNKEPKYAVSLKRKLGSKEYELVPGDKRYVMLIPTKVMNVSGLVQNER
ncbi:RagB/SusD family nutrient uptake outer membrane protein [Arcticibacter tournemirensis]|uniref:RagB/SusD family nutrient uptake outer membrane protein n=2 Tax=Pseudomonadati TaxID=3379134 RepID=A0A4Q0MA93_9SPHI|nr:RagB/SusD family nutrient uptake outer membrane protein [Arcticibacter tournemirensis]RXF70084.1 RagB/SusD family nutrient uptake outer membrane protein [Arcticibacter tournemirensis]